MIRILFVCHGNICRSVCAEKVLQHLVKEMHMEGWITAASAAATTEEIGNDVYPPMKKTLLAHGIPCPPHAARLLEKSDAERYDHLIAMDLENLYDMERILGKNAMKKASLLLDWAGLPGQEVADPWYTRDFERTLRDVDLGCRALLKRLAADPAFSRVQ